MSSQLFLQKKNSCLEIILANQIMRLWVDLGLSDMYMICEDKQIWNRGDCWRSGKKIKNTQNIKQNTF